MLNVLQFLSSTPRTTERCAHWIRTPEWMQAKQGLVDTSNSPVLGGSQTCKGLGCCLRQLLEIC